MFKKVLPFTRKRHVAGLKCAFTGHRPQNLPFRFDETDERCLRLKAELRNLIVQMIEQKNVTHFISGNPIQDGETVDGVEKGQMSRELQWKCQYEDAMLQPPRGVLDINMGEFAAGQR